MNAPTKDTIPSTSFGEFVPPDSALEVSPSKFVAMAGEAVRGDWIIPPEVFTELPQRLSEIAMGKDLRSATKAAKLLLEMNNQNCPAEQVGTCGGVTILLPHNYRDQMPVDATN